MDPSTALASSLASHGVLGLMLAIVLWAYWGKDQELKIERQARIDDAKSYTELALKVQAQVLDAVNKLGDILDQIKSMQSRSSR